MLNRLFGSAALACAVIASTSADARPARTDQVPGGDVFGCQTCHEAAAGGGARNLFGSQVEGALVGSPIDEATVDWAAIFDGDADGDGYTNGDELGDPDGVWVPGETPAFSASSLPAVVDDTPCGDGRISGGEQCDNDELGGATCVSLDAGEGTLGCTDACTYDTTGCDGGEAPTCGDGRATAEAGEECDGGDLAGQDCRSRGFDRGTLRCGDGCTFDTSECIGSADPICGNGVREGDEPCDGSDLGGSTCWTRGFGGGALGCGGGCTYDESACVPEDPWGDIGGFPGEFDDADAGVPGADTGADVGGSDGGSPGDDASGCSAVGRGGAGTVWLWVTGAAMLLARRRRPGRSCPGEREASVRV